MEATNMLKDRYGLLVSTSSPVAAGHYMDGLALMMAQNYGPAEKFQHAIDADEEFGLAHGALALMLF